eukprot:scaffold31315_cov49-Attheya_sp.AAC.7
MPVAIPLDSISLVYCRLEPRNLLILLNAIFAIPTYSLALFLHAVPSNSLTINSGTQEEMLYDRKILYSEQYKAHL